MWSFFQSKPRSQRNSAGYTDGSLPSGPWIASRTSAQSSTDRGMGPGLSMVQLRAMAPGRGTRPKVGRSPVSPQRVEGEEMEPSVSEPIAKATQPAATALAEPAEDPLDPCSGFHGLRVRPPNHLSPMASAPSVNLATSTAPAASRRSTTVASSSNDWFSKPPAPQVVG